MTITDTDDKNSSNGVGRGNAGELRPSQDLAGEQTPGQGGLLNAGLWGQNDDAERQTDSAAWLDNPSFPRADRAQVKASGSRLGNRRGSRDRAVVSKRGAVSGSVPAGAPFRDIDWSATLRAAAGAGRAKPAGPTLLRPSKDDLRRRKRTERPARLILFAVDLSGSMASKLTALAKRLALIALKEAYLARDRVAMVAFRGQAADQLFAPTNQQELVSRAFEGLELGGTTPLAAGLVCAYEVLERNRRRSAGVKSTLIVLSDGRANVGSRPGHGAIQNEVDAMAQTIAGLDDLTTVILDTTPEGRNDYPAARLAAQLGAHRLRLDRLGSEQDQPTRTWTRVASWLA